MKKLTIFSFNHYDTLRDVVAKTHLTKKQQEETYKNKNIPTNIEFVLLSTCYRSDILILSDTPLKDLTLIFKKNIPQFYTYFQYNKTFQGKDALLYFLKISMGLESTIIGETEIIKQIKDSFNLAKECKRIKKDFLEIYKTNHQLNKKIREELKLNKGSISHAYLAFRKALQLCPEKSLILLCGFGETNKKIAKYFYKIDHKLKPNFKIIFFTKHKKPEARLFLKQTKIKTAKIKNYIWLKKYLLKADCIFFATNTRKPILNNNYKKDLNLIKNKLSIVDLSVPSDCETDIKKHPKVNYFNLKALDKEVKKTQTEKKEKRKTFLNYVKTNKLFS